jgi:hypothetical protein
VGLKQEPGDRPRPPVLGGFRRHAEPGVVGEEGDQFVQVEALERADEAVDDGGLGRGLGNRHVVRVPVGVKACPGTDERAVDGGLRAPEDAGGLGRREAEHVPEYEDRPLLGWQVLQARHERQGDRLPCVVPGFGAGDQVVQIIRVGLEPPRLAGPYQPGPPAP